ncbi:MAG TPA: hypothetical protein VF875_12645 [Anaeromyxobacter sp.]
MEASIECTHCRVVMTSWSAPGSPIRYYQCPFCTRTHSSLYGEVFRRRAGARVLDAPMRAGRPTEIPMPSAEEMSWSRVKTSAARWFARLDADEQRCATGRAAPIRLVERAAADDVPELDPDEVLEVAPAVARRAR